MRVGITGRGGCAAEKFRSAVEAAPAAMILTGPGGRVEFANAETERMFGYRVDELVGKPVDILVPACARRRHASLRRTFLANPSKRPMGTGRDLKAVRRDGTEFPVEIGLTPIDADDGFLILATVVDISARHDVEEALSNRAMGRKNQ